MTRSNLYITLSNGSVLNCVCDSTSAPEQGYFMEQVLWPLLDFKDPVREAALLAEHCTINELRINASYRYHINLQTNEMSFHEEVYNFQFGSFKAGRNLTYRLTAYRDKVNAFYSNQFNRNHK